VRGDGTTRERKNAKDGWRSPKQNWSHWILPKQRESYACML
jgi:hypothetical protein